MINWNAVALTLVTMISVVVVASWLSTINEYMLETILVYIAVAVILGVFAYFLYHYFAGVV